MKQTQPYSFTKNEGIFFFFFFFVCVCVIDPWFNWADLVVNLTFDLRQISCVELSRSKEKNYILEVWLEMRIENMEIEFKKLKFQTQIYSFRSLTKSKKIPFYQKPKIP